MAFCYGRFGRTAARHIRPCQLSKYLRSCKSATGWRSPTYATTTFMRTSCLAAGCSTTRRGQRLGKYWTVTVTMWPRVGREQWAKSSPNWLDKTRRAQFTLMTSSNILARQSRWRNRNRTIRFESSATSINKRSFSIEKNPPANNSSKNNLHLCGKKDERINLSERLGWKRDDFFFSKLFSNFFFNFFWGVYRTKTEI